MEFEDIKKIWDSQNNQPMYAINEDALHRRIRTHRSHSQWASNITEITLIAVAILTAGYLIVKNMGGDNIYGYPPAIIMLLTGIYVFIGRMRRKRAEMQFDRSMLGDLDQAIANVSFEIRRARTFIWWYMLPLAIPITINMYMNQAPIWKWLFVAGGLILSYFVVQYGLNRKQVPRRNALEALRSKLIDQE